jgi:hypothetical protein
LAADRCAMRMSCHLFSARQVNLRQVNLRQCLASPGRLQTATATYARTTYRPTTECRSANTAAWRVRPMHAIRVVAPVALG